MNRRTSLIIGMVMFSLVGLGGITEVLYGIFLADPFGGRHPENLALIRRMWTQNGLIEIVAALVVLPVFAWRLGRARREDGSNPK